MNILFLSLDNFETFNRPGIYTELLSELSKNNNVYSVGCYERREGKKTDLKKEGENANILNVKTFNITQTNIVEKGIGILRISSQYKKAIKKYFKGVKFDLILYPTPPITLYSVVKYFKKRDNAKTYLMLKDIFPQNAVDIGMMKKTGVKGILYKYFKNKEKKLYAISDTIGCMSDANAKYILENNSEVSKDKVEFFPNCVIVKDYSVSEEEKILLRKKYNLPLNKKIFVYGGNLGRPQNIPFIIECLKEVKEKENAFFLIVGNGTEYGKLEKYFNDSKQENFLLMNSLPKDEYDKMIASCDVGMIFLDFRFTIPNFPSRLLSYMQAKLPVIACTDPNTDIGKIISDGGFGWWCYSNSVKDFSDTVDKALSDDLISKKEKEFKFLKENYSVEKNISKLFK
ncbi:MAG: glycosyltransferase family 4 protein [Clostridia bacterium]|nr:glycosyltransferase family 4 protein [Clostridia bacterium]